MKQKKRKSSDQEMENIGKEEASLDRRKEERKEENKGIERNRVEYGRNKEELR